MSSSFRRYVIPVVSSVAGTVAVLSPASAHETKTYKYDARGRLVEVKSTGTVNDDTKTAYEHDKANNRKKKTKTGV